MRSVVHFPAGGSSTWPGCSASITDDHQVWICDADDVIEETYQPEEWTKVEVFNE